jgi:hypothetical protein
MSYWFIIYYCIYCSSVTGYFKFSQRRVRRRLSCGTLRAVQSGRNWPTFQRSLPPPASGPWRQKTVISRKLVRTGNWTRIRETRKIRTLLVEFWWENILENVRSENREYRILELRRILSCDGRWTETGSELCSISGFGIRCVQRSGSTTVIAIMNGCYCWDFRRLDSNSYCLWESIAYPSKQRASL